MVIIPICIFTIAYRDKDSALGRQGEEEEAMDTLRISVLFRVTGDWLDARCSGGDFESLFYAVLVEQWSWKDCGVVGSASIVELYPVHTLPKSPGCHCETNSIRVTFFQACH